MYIHLITLFILGDLASEECKKDAIPFLCLYGFPIFSCLEQKLVLPTKEECERIITTTCQEEFNLVVQVGFDGLPDCNELPSNKNFPGIYIYIYIYICKYICIYVYVCDQ